MNKPTKLILFLFILIGAVFITFSLFTSTSKATLSENEAKKIVQSQYGGTVKSIKNDNKDGTILYKVVIDTKKGVYEVTIDSKTEKIGNIKLVSNHIEKRNHTIEEAKTAIEKSTRGTVTLINKSEQDGTPVAIANVKVQSENKKVVYNLEDKKVTSITSVPDSSNSTNTGVTTKPLIPQNEAVAIAQKQVNGKVMNVQLINTKTGQQYKVTIENSKEGAHVYVQANSGEISSFSWYEKDQPPSNQIVPPSDDDDDDTDNDNDEDDQDDD